MSNRKQIASGKCMRDRLSLNRCRLRVARSGHGIDNLLAQSEICKCHLCCFCPKPIQALKALLLPSRTACKKVGLPEAEARPTPGARRHRQVELTDRDKSTG